MKLNRKRGQSILEYTLILGVVIAAIIAVLFGGGGGASNVSTSVQATFTRSSEALNKSVGDMIYGVFR